MSLVPARMPALLHDLLLRHPGHWTSRPALVDTAAELTYGQLADAVDRAQSGLQALALQRGDRVAVYLEKRVEAVVAAFAAAAAGGVLVPLNPALKAPQVAHVLRDAQPRVLVTSAARWRALIAGLNGDGPHGQAGTAAGVGLQTVILVDEPAVSAATIPTVVSGPSLVAWPELLASPRRAAPRMIDADLAAILYTSGSTGLPKGVMLSHRNLVVGARSVVEYLDNGPDDVLLAALPLSFDAGFSQLTTAFTAGARVALLNHLLPQDVLRAMAEYRVTGLTAVPPLYHQLAQLPPARWTSDAHACLRYFASTGGAMPAGTLSTLRQRMPRARPFLMYGLTEAFRSTFLPPEEVDARPGSIGRAIPNAEVLVLDEQGRDCPPDVPGELVHRGPLVALGYWGDAQRTAERFRPLPAGVAGRTPGQVLPEWVVFSGDRVRRDADGFLYHLGRFDEMIKTSGYRVSPAELEPVLMAAPGVDECVVFGEADEALGQRVVAVVALTAGVPPLTALASGLADTRPVDGSLAGGPSPEDFSAALLRHCRQQLPAYLVPSRWVLHEGALPRNANGKLDRAALKARYAQAPGTTPS